MSSEEKQQINQEQLKVAEPAPASIIDGLISIDDFAKVQLRVGQVMSAEEIPGSEKLLKLQVDLGEEGRTRQILSGIKKYYKTEELVGRKIIVVSNLKPAKLMGQLSEGMLLAASDSRGNLELLSAGNVLPAGAVVR